jgi:hypothetical protein
MANKGRFYWGKKEKDIKRMVLTSPRQECKFYENIEEGENEEDAEDIWAQKEMTGNEYLRPPLGSLEKRQEQRGAIVDMRPQNKPCVAVARPLAFWASVKEVAEAVLKEAAG